MLYKFKTTFNFCCFQIIWYFNLWLPCSRTVDLPHLPLWICVGDNICNVQYMFWSIRENVSFLQCLIFGRMRKDKKKSSKLIREEMESGIPFQNRPPLRKYNRYIVANKLFYFVVSPNLINIRRSNLKKLISFFWHQTCLNKLFCYMVYAQEPKITILRIKNLLIVLSVYKWINTQH